jgi:hypothetical protein
VTGRVTGGDGYFRGGPTSPPTKDTTQAPVTIGREGHAVTGRDPVTGRDGYFRVFSYVHTREGKTPKFPSPPVTRHTLTLVAGSMIPGEISNDPGPEPLPSRFWPDS